MKTEQRLLYGRRPDSIFRQVILVGESEVDKPIDTLLRSHPVFQQVALVGGFRDALRDIIW